MVSKTFLACLAVLASISMIQGTVIASPKHFGYCVQGLGFLNGALKLKVDLAGLLSGVLGVAAELINGVLQTVVELLKNVLGLVGNLLSFILGGGVLSGGAKGDLSQIPAPANIGQFLQVLLKYLTFYDTLCAKQFGSAWKSGTLVNVYLNVLNIVKLDLGVGGLDILNGVISQSQCQSDVEDILAALENNALYKSKNFAQISVYLSTYLNLIKGNITLDAYIQLLILSIQIQASFLQLGGYPNVDYYVGSWVDTCNQVHSGISANIQVTLDVVAIPGVPKKCSCLKSA